MKAKLLALARNAWLPAAMLLAAGAAPACGQTRAAIYVMKVDGGEVRKVSHHDERWLGSPAWSHDAKRLPYDAAPPNRGENILSGCPILGVHFTGGAWPAIPGMPPIARPA